MAAPSSCGFVNKDVKALSPAVLKNSNSLLGNLNFITI
jgi:hypothetical protein